MGQVFLNGHLPVHYGGMDVLNDVPALFGGKAPYTTCVKVKVCCAHLLKGVPSVQWH